MNKQEFKGGVENIEMFLDNIRNAEEMNYDLLADIEQVFKSAECMLEKAKRIYYNG